MDKCNMHARLDIDALRIRCMGNTPVLPSLNLILLFLSVGLVVHRYTRRYITRPARVGITVGVHKRA